MCLYIHLIFLIIFLRLYFIFREGKGRREREKHQCVVASCTPPTGDLAHNPGMCPDRELNRLATLWFTGRHLIH